MVVSSTAARHRNVEVGYRDGIPYRRVPAHEWPRLVADLYELRGVHPEVLRVSVGLVHLGKYEPCEKCGVPVVAVRCRPDWALAMVEIRVLWQRLDGLMSPDHVAAVGRHEHHQCRPEESFAPVGFEEGER